MEKREPLSLLRRHGAAMRVIKHTPTTEQERVKLLLIVLRPDLADGTDGTT